MQRIKKAPFCVRTIAAQGVYFLDNAGTSSTSPLPDHEDQNLREVLSTTPYKADMQRGVLACWKAALAGPRKAPVYFNTRLAPALCLIDFRDWILASRWHLAMFPIPPRNHLVRARSLDTR